MSYLTCTEGGSDKFYQIFAIGNNVSMKYGKTGSDGVSSTKSFGSADEANKFVNKTVAEKLKKGYVESTAIGSKRPAPAAAEPAVKKQKATPAPKASAASKIPVSESGVKKTSYLTCQEGNSDKFYEISIDGTNVSMRYGRTGTSGVSSVKEFASVTEASKFVDKTLNEKLKKGYVEDGSDDKKSPTASAKQVPVVKAAAKPVKVAAKPSKAAASAAAAPFKAGQTTYLTCQEGNSDKFYEISISGTEVTMRYGKTGSDGVTNLKSFGSAAEAEKFVTKTINEKLKKGYEEGEGGGDGDDAEEMEDEDDEEDDEDDSDDSVDPSGRTYMTCTEGNSNKFYEVIQRGCEVATRYGKIGSDGTSSSKTMKSEAEAKKAADKIVADKVKGGYVVERPAAKGKKAQEKVKDDPSDTPYNKANIKALEWLFC